MNYKEFNIILDCEWEEWYDNKSKCFVGAVQGTWLPFEGAQKSAPREFGLVDGKGHDK